MIALTNSTVLPKSKALFLAGLWISLFIQSTTAFSTQIGKQAIVWFRDHALRTEDNDALRLAIESWRHETEGDSSISYNAFKFVFLWEKSIASSGGTASDVFMVHTLDSLNKTLGGRLEIVDCTGTSPLCDGSDASAKIMRTVQTLHEFALSGGQSSNELYYLETYDRQFEIELSCSLKEQKFVVQAICGTHTLTGNHKLDPASLLREAITGHPFNSPLIPFVANLNSILEREPLPQVQPFDLQCLSELHCPLGASAPTRLSFVSVQELLQTVGTTRQTTWGTSIADRWPATERAASEALDMFVQSQYPSLVGTETKGLPGDKIGKQKQRRTHLASFLSPYLSKGLLSPQQVYHALDNAPVKNNDKQNSFLRRLAWRDYAYAVSAVFPDSIAKEEPIRLGYERETSMDDEGCPDRNSAELLSKWKQGKTGFPLVDAGMRQLITEGFMPQQVRLATSACLVESLNVSWRLGMRHFEEYLVDFDAVINTQMWLNAAGIGLDPYYLGLDYKKRPYWDSDGLYVRTWCPELEKLDRVQVVPSTPGTGGTNTVDALYSPWKAPSEILENAGIILGEDYPYPVCDEREGRRQFLNRLRQCRSSWSSSEIDKSGNDLVRVGGMKVGAFTPRCLRV